MWLTGKQNKVQLVTVDGVHARLAVDRRLRDVPLCSWKGRCWHCSTQPMTEQACDLPMSSILRASYMFMISFPSTRGTKQRLLEMNTASRMGEVSISLVPIDRYTATAREALNTCDRMMVSATLADCKAHSSLVIALSDFAMLVRVSFFRAVIVLAM